MSKSNSQHSNAYFQNALVGLKIRTKRLGFSKKGKTSETIVWNLYLPCDYNFFLSFVSSLFKTSKDCTSSKRPNLAWNSHIQ